MNEKAMAPRRLPLHGNCNSLEDSDSRLYDSTLLSLALSEGEGNEVEGEGAGEGEGKEVEGEGAGEGEGKEVEGEDEEKRGNFDDTLSKMGGKLGRIDVYENGEAELVITGEDGSEMRLDVSTGIECGFKRTAAIMDIEKEQYGDLGDISKTIVVTPQITGEW
ncbi:hypothetical protein TrRE_jg6282 [Triparma retinervis]|uniref:Uncharacterized protein n=1 Tax=Triparma retinervis TaxID=2557542 RepID=A0A9W7ED26_9STRA|nr:hypothetical protein TrRE_jg6282 [Triparma retinervis]